MEIAFWPHIWAIPLILLIGFVIGWTLRSQVDTRQDHRGETPQRADLAPLQTDRADDSEDIDDL